MFGLPKGEAANNDRDASAARQFQRPGVAYSAPPEPAESISCVSSGTSIVGKIVGEGTVKIFGRVEGELHASTVLIADGAQLDGDVVADDLTVGGRIKGTIHANRVKLNSTAVVEGDIFHRSLSIEENARFEGSSRREENAAGAPSRGQPSRPQPQVAAIEGKRKRNGAPGDEEHAKPAAAAT